MCSAKLIGIDATPLLKVKGGVGFYVNELLHSMIVDSSDLEFVLFCPRITEDIERFGKYSNVQLVECSLMSKSEALWSQTTLVFLLRRHKVDLFWGATQSLPLLASSKLLTILTIHDFTYLLYPQTMSIGRRLYLRHFSGSIISRSDRILVNSAATGSRLEKYYNKKFDGIVLPPIRGFAEVTKNEMLGHLASYNLKKKAFCVCVASFEPRKNLLSLLEHYSSLLERGHYLLPLVIIGGNGWKNKDILASIDIYKVRYPRQLIFLDFVGDTVMSVFLRSAKVLIMPSFYEGYGMPIAEARSVGVPIIATDIPEHREAAENDGIFFALNDMRATLARYLDCSYEHSMNAKASYVSASGLARIVSAHIRELLSSRE